MNLEVWAVALVITFVLTIIKPKEEVVEGFDQFMNVEGMYRTRIPLAGTTRCFSCERELLANRYMGHLIPSLMI